MLRVPVDSTSIASIGYDVDTRTLEVEFHNGSLYQYVDVPSEAHLALVTAESIGTHFNTVFRPAGYDYVRVR